MVKINDSEMRLMNLIWTREPVNSTELTRLAMESLGWKKSTTYTVLRRLCDRGAVRNENAVVTALVGRSQVWERESTRLIDKVYDGSLKLFLASFLEREKLTEAEALELKALIDRHTEQGEGK